MLLDLCCRCFIRQRRAALPFSENQRHLLQCAFLVVVEAALAERRRSLGRHHALDRQLLPIAPAQQVGLLRVALGQRIEAVGEHGVQGNVAGERGLALQVLPHERGVAQRGGG